MENFFNKIRTPNGKRWLLFVAIGLLILYGIYNQHEREDALRNTILDTAKITEIDPARSTKTVWVKYKYGKKYIENSFSFNGDTLKVGDSILLKVSNEYPDTYIEYFRRLK